jgi:hypothetical protein
MEPWDSAWTCMFLDHKVQENALGKLTPDEKKEKHHQAGLAKKAGGAQISAGLLAITDGYAIRHECLAWAMGTPYSIGKGKTGKGKGKERKGKSREVRTNYVEGEGGY